MTVEHVFIMFDEPVVELLIYIYKNGGKVENFRALMTKLDFSFSKLDRARRKLKGYGLIKEEIVKGAPVVLRIELTGKGRLVAEKILELKKILGD